MRFYTRTIKLGVWRERGTINLNRDMQAAVERSGIRNGLITVQSLHTTAGLICQEDEKGILEHDMPLLLERLVPSGAECRHDDLAERIPRPEQDERKNGRAHLEHLLVAHPSLTFIVHDFKIEFGDWLAVLFVDFDPHGRNPRKVKIAVMGE